jgi:hypothetical protein
MSRTDPSLSGFALLEAVIALTITGLAAIGLLSAFAAQLSAESTALRQLEVKALAEEQLSALKIAPTQGLVSLPDSLSKGAFAPPFDHYRWTQRATMSRELPGLFLLDISVERRAEAGSEFSSVEGSWTVSTRIFRPQAARVRE